jgi:hypothetical protein
MNSAFTQHAYVLNSGKNEKVAKSLKMRHRGHGVKGEKHKTSNN